MTGKLTIDPHIIARAWLVLLEAEKARRDAVRTSASTVRQQ